MPKTAVKQVKYGMFGTADIQIDRHPVVFFGFRERFRVIFRIDEPEIIPA